jgi:hypothetical protein
MADYEDEQQQQSAESTVDAPQSSSAEASAEQCEPNMSVAPPAQESAEPRADVFAGQYDGEKVPWCDPQRPVQEKLDREALAEATDSPEREAAERRISDRDKPIESDPVGNALVSGAVGLARGAIFGTTSLLRGLVNGFSRPGAGAVPSGVSGATSGAISGSGVIGKTLSSALPQTDVAREQEQRRIDESQ